MTSSVVILICRAGTALLQRNCPDGDYAARGKSFRPSGTKIDREVLANPTAVLEHHLKASEKYRLKALTCEKLAQEATDEDTQAAWSELAIEWHILASRIAQDDKDVEVEID
jgi:hypothetical protein